jgi:glutamyl-tRNA reductase
MSYKKIEKKENEAKSVFTYSVQMIVSVFAENEEKAKEQLDQNGGFVSNRVVELKDVVSIYTPE